MKKIQLKQTIHFNLFDPRQKQHSTIRLSIFIPIEPSEWKRFHCNKFSHLSHWNIKENEYISQESWSFNISNDAEMHLQVFMRSFYGNFLIIKHDLIEIEMNNYGIKPFCLRHKAFKEEKNNNNNKQIIVCMCLFCHSWESNVAISVYKSKKGKQKRTCFFRMNKKTKVLHWSSSIGWLLQFDIFVPLQLKESLN